MKLKRNRRLLLILSLLTTLLVTYEILLTWKFHPIGFTSVHGTVHVWDPYPMNTNYSRRGHSLRKLLEDSDIKDLPVRISPDCTLEQLSQSINGGDIICVNETRLWSEVTQHGVKINQLTQVQAKTAIRSAVFEELKSRQVRAKEQIRLQFVNKRLSQTGLKANFHIDSKNKLDTRQHKVHLESTPSFYDHMVASFVKEAKNKPSDFAIPSLDSFYERHLPIENPSEEVDDFDGLFPVDMKPKKKVKRPFHSVVMDNNNLLNHWDNPLNNQWKRSNIPGIPRMPDKLPDVPDNYLKGIHVSVPQAPTKIPNIQRTSRNIPRVKSGIPEMPAFIPKMPAYIPKMPELPPSITEIPIIASDLLNVIKPPDHPTVFQDHQQSITPSGPISSLGTVTHVESAMSGKNKTKHSKSVSALSDDLLQLSSFKFRKNFDLIMRKLPTRFKYDGIRIKDRLKFIERAVNATDSVLKDLVELSLNPDILERAKFQQQQMSEFCSRGDDVDIELPSSADELNTLFQHLLYDDSRRMIFCYVPKNACSNMKRMMLVLNGILPPESIMDKRPPELQLKQVHSFRNLTKKEAIYKLNNYYKFAIVRNPLERLVSAYRNKLETPLNYTLRRSFPDRLKAYILKKYRREELEDWIADEVAHNTTDIHPTFSEFLKFMTRFSLNVYNEHFKPTLRLCFPCAVHYDLFINFKTLEYDIFALMQFLNIPFQYYPESIAHRNVSTGSYLAEYFKDVDIELKVRLFHAFRDELDFYFTLHPEEWGMHHGL